MASSDDPSQNAFSGIFIQVLAVILDVGLPLDLGNEGNHDEPAPDAVIRCGNTRQMVVYKTSVWQGLEGERVFVFLSANTSSVEQSCLTVESLSLAPSCISAAIRRRLPLTPPFPV